MKKIFLLGCKCICVLLPLIVLCFYCGSSLMAFTDDEIPYYLWNKDAVSQGQERVRVIALGDSVANAAYTPEVLSDDTINLSLGGTTALENYYVMKEWLEKNDAPEIVYISFMDFHMYQSDCFWKRSMFSHRFPFPVNLEMLRAAFADQELSILEDGWPFSFLSYELYLPNKYITALINASLNQRYESNMAAYQSVDLHKGRYISKNNIEYVPDGLMEFDTFYVAPLFDQYYRKLIELCQRNGIQVRIVKLPLPDNTSFTAQYTNQFWAYYQELMEDYPGLSVEWFSIYEPFYFSDAHHMNAHGAFRFSQELRERFPDDFSNQEMSERRIEAVNEDILAENKVDELYHWTDLGDWELLRIENEDRTEIQVLDHYHDSIVRQGVLDGIFVQ